MCKLFFSVLRKKIVLLCFEITKWLFLKSSKQMIRFGRILGTKDVIINDQLEKISYARSNISIDTASHKLSNLKKDFISDGLVYCNEVIGILDNSNISFVLMDADHKSIINLAIDRGEICKAISEIRKSNALTKNVSIFPRVIDENFKGEIELVFYDKSRVYLNAVIKLEIWHRKANMYSCYSSSGGIRAFECGITKGKSDKVSSSELAELEHLKKTLPASLLKIGDNFKIDIVYTWVTSDDATWREKRNKYLKNDAHSEDMSEMRFKQYDELLYSMRSVESYFPYFNKIYIVTDSQVPKWLKADNNRISIVDHQELFSDDKDLPTFNSHAIESQLHKIQGLNEHFIYFNDDVMLWNPCVPEDFFTSTGQSKSFLETHSVPILTCSSSHSGFFNATNNTRRIFSKEGIGAYKSHKHAPFSLKKSVIKALSEKYESELLMTAANHIRSKNDISIFHLYQYYALLNYQAVEGVLISEYVTTSDNDFDKSMGRLLNDDMIKTICINDTSSSELSSHRQMRKFLREKFPFKVDWEI